MSINLIRMTHILANLMIGACFTGSDLFLVLILILFILFVKNGFVLNKFPWNTHITYLPVSGDVSAWAHMVMINII